MVIVIMIITILTFLYRSIKFEKRYFIISFSSINALSMKVKFPFSFLLIPGPDSCPFVSCFCPENFAFPSKEITGNFLKVFCILPESIDCWPE